MAEDIRAMMRDRMRDAIERWEGIVTLKQSNGGAELQDARYVLHRIKCALNVLRSRAHAKYVTDQWLRDISPRRPTSEIAGLIETMVPGGFPEPPSGRPLTKGERYRIISGSLTVPRSVYDEAVRLDELENPPESDL